MIITVSPVSIPEINNWLRKLKTNKSPVLMAFLMKCSKPVEMCCQNSKIINFDSQPRVCSSPWAAGFIVPYIKVAVLLFPQTTEEFQLLVLWENYARLSLMHACTTS